MNAFANTNCEAIFIIDCSNQFHLDIIDFITNHKSVEYMSFNLDELYVAYGGYHNIRKKVCLMDIYKNQYTLNVSETLKLDRYKPIVAKVYANRNSCYFYAEKDGIEFQSDDISIDMIKEWCVEKANV